MRLRIIPLAGVKQGKNLWEGQIQVRAKLLGGRTHDEIFRGLYYKYRFFGVAAAILVTPETTPLFRVLPHYSLELLL